MPLCLTSDIADVCRRITGRERSLFASDIATQRTALDAGLRGARVLVAGGAGSIGSATIRELLAYDPAALAVLDPSENNLAELIRHIRAHAGSWRGDLLPAPLDYASPLAHGWMARQQPFDLVWSFAALKHVRSERDEFSLLRMLEVNLLGADRFLAACRRQGHGRRGVFLVSTDKAADPVSLMGASKRAMEHLLWAHAAAGAPAALAAGGTAPPLPRITTTRFANVLFSDGSLPWAMLQRVAKGQPLAAPGDIRRYLVSPEESGHLCLLAAMRAPHRHVLVPRLDPALHQRTFVQVAEALLAQRGLRPNRVADEAAARAAATGDGSWPLLVTTSDTSGEKTEEIFVGKGETARECGLTSADAVAGPADDRLAALTALLHLIRQHADDGAPPTKAVLAQAIAAVVPAFHHLDTGRSLDGKL